MELWAGVQLSGKALPSMQEALCSIPTAMQKGKKEKKEESRWWYQTCAEVLPFCKNLRKVTYLKSLVDELNL